MISSSFASTTLSVDQTPDSAIVSARVVAPAENDEPQGSAFADA